MITEWPMSGLSVKTKLHSPGVSSSRNLSKRAACFPLKYYTNHRFLHSEMFNISASLPKRVRKSKILMGIVPIKHVVLKSEVEVVDMNSGLWGVQ